MPQYQQRRHIGLFAAPCAQLVYDSILHSGWIKSGHATDSENKYTQTNKQTPLSVQRMRVSTNHLRLNHRRHTQVRKNDVLHSHGGIACETLCGKPANSAAAHLATIIAQ